MSMVNGLLYSLRISTRNAKQDLSPVPGRDLVKIRETGSGERWVAGEYGRRGRSTGEFISKS